MSTKGDSLKTNEFLRLRKLRLQQVREQSKDIAKKIRQRAKVEQLRQVTNVDTNKEKVYLERQEKFINRLEQLYSKGLQNVGAGHKNASDVNEREIAEKTDLSKLRGKEAAAVLKRKKQEKLNEQKKLLDRKLRAREVANVLSREKFAVVANTLVKSLNDKNIKEVDNDDNTVKDKPASVNIGDRPDTGSKHDMGTQWEFEEIPQEWEPNIPILPISNNDSMKNSADDNGQILDQNKKIKRLNLFALSDEMPSSLRGGITSVSNEQIPSKPSLTLVSEYLQSRGLRLRETNSTCPQKKSSDDLQSIKETLLKTRASTTNGSVFPNICHVLDEQVIPMPSWRPEKNFGLCCHANKHIPLHYKNTLNCNNSFYNAQMLKPDYPHFSLYYEQSKPSPRFHNCRHGLKIPVSGRSNNIELSTKSDNANRVIRKKNSVTMYDHNTKDSRDLPHDVDKLVVREISNNEDAYSQAAKESSIVDNDHKVHDLQQQARNSLAIRRQNVDKEYRDTLAFLNSLPKERPPKCIRRAYMDTDREQDLKNKQQRKLQEEYKRIEKQGSKHQCKHSRNKISSRVPSRSKSKSPFRVDIDNNIVNRDFQYSWLPVPESDENMAIHTIPNTLNEKPGNTVKFSSVDTYHEYRSRHKHTPPTKDVDNGPNKRVVEAVIIENSNDSSNSFHSETDTSSVENLRMEQNSLSDHKARQADTDNHLADAERIIIYKVVESKKSKKHKTKKKLQNVANIDQNYETSNKSPKIRCEDGKNDNNKDSTDQIKANNVSFTQLKEGVYKCVSKQGDNIASMYFPEDQHNGKSNQDVNNTVVEKDIIGNITSNRTDEDEKNINRITKSCEKCKPTNLHKHAENNLSTGTSTSTFKTAVNDKASNVLHEDRFIKFVDEGGQDSGKFYVGASGFLKDDAYEVIIQLRKKEAEKNKNVLQDKNSNAPSTEKKMDDEHNVEQHSSALPFPDQIMNSSKIITESGNFESVHKEKCDLTSTKNSVHEEIIIPNTKRSASNEVREMDIRHVESPTKSPEISDKGISTTFRDAFAIPDDMPKSDPIFKPATSVYTQTTQNNSIPRPVLMHLSSSTSTTYMSPPELVLPLYLRKGSSESPNDTYDPISSHLYSQDMRCTCSKICCKKRYKGVQSTTPLNTNRNVNKSESNSVNKKKCKNSEITHKTVPLHKCKNLCNQSEPKISKKKSRGSISESKRFRSRSKCSTLSNSKSKTINKLDKVYLNPVIENYVKKLLHLNKEGLKAIEVVNQECSAVGTPGSSIIDVPSNIDMNRITVCNKISLEQIKNSLKEQILTNPDNRKLPTKYAGKSIGSQTEKNKIFSYKCNKKRPVHKVKSFNISKQFMKPNKANRCQSTQSTILTTSPSSVNSRKENSNYECSCKSNFCGEKSPTRTVINNSSSSETNKTSAKASQSKDKLKPCKKIIKMRTCNKHYPSKSEIGRESEYPFPSHKATLVSQSSESLASNDLRKRRNLATPPISISTQTNQVDSEVEFMKLAENKLQNMEKIADLTEKCTKRLSNLAKVLEEVRKNKSLAYSQISTSDSTSDSDKRSDKNMQTSNNQRSKTFNPVVEIETLNKALSSMPTSPEEQKRQDLDNVSANVQVLMDLPKPDVFKIPSPLSFSTDNDKANVHIVMEQQNFKNKGKPPPALTRINLKHVPEDLIIPHELSTVVEVDSPMSMKLKSNTTEIDNKYTDVDTENVDNIHRSKIDDVIITRDTRNKPVDLDHFISNTSKRKHDTQPMHTSEDLKMNMMDLTHFNEIMLKPFISLKDYAKQYDEGLDGQTSLNGNSKDENANEDLSSLHSEASLPDVMAELLKRNLISEPFKFETTSNVNSTTMSSESTLSLLALSRARKAKKNSDMIAKNKENIAESSVSLSISSNPDLEHAFQRLGMGWASSTLKKTKERLALSSSSNTSSSSIPQIKLKSFNYQDIPELSSLLNISNMEKSIKPQRESISETSKNAVQQTSLTNSMTVKEFLTNELANKITFSNKTKRNITEEEFISLSETKMPEEIKHLSQRVEINEKSVDTLPSGSNNRARTSTPVQIFKSMTYQSTSSSNTSNGLFSNVDDLSSVKGTSNSLKNHSTSDKDDLTIPNYSLKMKKDMTECSKTD